MATVDEIASMMECAEFGAKDAAELKHIEGNVAFHFPELPNNGSLLPTLKKYQSQMLHQMLAHENILYWATPAPYTSMYNTHTIVHMPTGSGKTIVGLQMCSFTMYPSHVDTTSQFECVGSAGPNGAASICFTANTDSFPNVDSTLIIVPPHLVQHWQECAQTVFRWKNGIDFIVRTEYKKKPALKSRPSKKAKNVPIEEASEEDLPKCVIVAATRANMTHAFSKGMWRRIIIDEPELVAKSVSIPIGYHTFMLTASTDELFKIKNCCVSSIIQHVKDFDKKVKNIDFIDKMTISLDRQYYATFQMHDMKVQYEVVSGPKMLAKVISTLPNGTNSEVTLALNMDDFTKVAHMLRLSEEEVQDIDEFCDLINKNIDRTAKEMMNVLVSVQQAEFLRCLDGIRANIQTIKDEFVMGVGADAKVKKMMSILRKSDGEKTVILCKYGSHLVKSALEKEHIAYVDLSQMLKPCTSDPSPISEQVARMLHTVKNGNKDVILVNPKYYGRGLDMQFAKHMIVMHSIAPHYVTQWTGRAFRQNRKEDLHVTYIYTDCEPPMDDNEATDDENDV